jgi:hypothetical protein
VDGPAGQTSGGPINILTAIGSWRAWTLQRIRFWTTRRPEWIARAYTGREAGRATLKRLNILHTATWLRVGRFPAIGGCPPETFRWVLFCSNFAGPWDPYRQAFLDVQGRGIRTMWGASLGFPPFPRRGSRYDLEEYISYRLPPTLHYFRAYPGVTPGDVRGAVRLARELEALALSWPTRSAAGEDALEAIFNRFLTRVQDSLGGVPDSAVRVHATFGPPTATGMSNMASLAPILPGHEERTRRRIEELPAAECSPFREVPGTHFARLAVLDRRTAAFHPRPAVSLRNSWLLFVVDFDGGFALEPFAARRMEVGEIRRYLRAVDEVPKLRNLWSDCYGFRPTVALEDLLEPSVVERFVLFRNHGDNTLRQILPALKLKRWFMEELAAGALRRPDQIERFLAGVRDEIDKRRECARP